MNKTTRLILQFGLVFCVTLVSGCAFNLADVTYQLAPLKQTGSDVAPIKLAADIPIHGAPCGYSRNLRKDTLWEPVGMVEQGVVFRSRGQTLTVECSNVFEAYLVVAEQRLVGFYLPVEKGYSPLDEPIPLIGSQQP